MKSLKRFSKRQKIVALSLCALSLCALVVIIGVVLRNADPYRRLEKENVLVVFRYDTPDQSRRSSSKAVRRPVEVWVPSNFDKWELLPKVTAQMPPDGRFNLFSASYSRRIDDASFLELLNNNALIHVKELELINCKKLGDESIGQICQLTNLQELILISTNCSDESVSKLSSLPSLKQLILPKTQVTGECFNCEGWNALERLDVDYCPISKNLFVYLAKLPRLKSLAVLYYEGVVEDLEELTARTNIEAIIINTVELPKEEADRLALQYADNPKIVFSACDYRFFDLKQEWMDTHADPWL